MNGNTKRQLKFPSPSRDLSDTERHNRDIHIRINCECCNHLSNLNVLMKSGLLIWRVYLNTRLLKPFTATVKTAIIIETTGLERWDRIGKQATKSRYVGQCEVLRMGRILWQDFHLLRPLQCRFILQICHKVHLSHNNPTEFTASLSPTNQRQS